MSPLKKFALLFVLAMAISIYHCFRVYINNYLDVDTKLMFHCKSSDEDLGSHIIQHGGDFNWEFSIDIGSSLIYDCDLSFANVRGHYKMFDERRAAGHEYLKKLCLLLVLAVAISISHGFQVSITNDSGVNTNLTVHCRSGSRDLGRHAIEYEDEFIWEININIGSQTIYDIHHGSISSALAIRRPNKDPLPSNFSSKKIEALLAFSTIPPSVNQVEMNPAWQQRQLREFCKSKSIIVNVFSPFGAVGSCWGTNQVMNNEALKQIADAHGETVAQVCLRWIIEQGAIVIAKSFNKERLKENLDIFDWALTDHDYDKSNQIPEYRMMPRDEYITPHGPFKTLEELWDE
ncbi:hypothetical protein WN944_026398 [Citrus x changshan-huyou]|uniref:NADP-dependent oxidoreductase domain-containing protein n=1 Tax=Citrus x changshan-huyou TaxID=2935761 RepID=A0AAP0LRI7_9ROSI